MFLDFITVKYKNSITRPQVECQKTLINVGFWIVNFELIENEYQVKFVLR
jgi:hypothetical protein